MCPAPRVTGWARPWCALTAEQLRDSAKTVLSAFKVPTVWLLLDSDDALPRGGTAKVDIRRLREMLIEGL